MRITASNIRWIVLTAFITSMAVGSFAASPGKITVGGQEFAEHLIISHMIAELLEAQGYEVTRTLGLGGPQIVFPGMLRGEIDVWVSYSGSLASVILDKDLELGLDPDELYAENQKDLMERYNIIHLDTLGFNNTYVFVVKPEFAEKHNLTKVSDLIPIAHQYRIAGSINFMGDRPDGIKGVEQRYGMKFARNVQLETAFMYPALQSGQVDIIVGFSTHGQIPAMGLVMLEDDRQLFPPYYAGILVTQQAADANPGLVAVLDKLTGIIDEVTMGALNDRVEGTGREDPRTVARDYLKQVGLIE